MRRISQWGRNQTSINDNGQIARFWKVNKKKFDTYKKSHTIKLIIHKFYKANKRKKQTFENVATRLKATAHHYHERLYYEKFHME